MSYLKLPPLEPRVTDFYVLQNNQTRLKFYLLLIKAAIYREGFSHSAWLFHTIIETSSEWTETYRTRVWFQIIHRTHSSEYTVDDFYSWETSRNIATNLSKNYDQAYLLKISTLPTPEKCSAWSSSKYLYIVSRTFYLDTLPGLPPYILKQETNSNQILGNQNHMKIARDAYGYICTHNCNLQAYGLYVFH